MPGRGKGRGRGIGFGGLVRVLQLFFFFLSWVLGPWGKELRRLAPGVGQESDTARELLNFFFSANFLLVGT